MAKKYLYSVFDKKTGCFDDPRAYIAEAMAHRAFIGAFRDSQTNMLQEYPSDFSLVYIGVFDTVSGEMDLDNNRVTSMEGTEAMHIANQIDKRHALQELEREAAKHLLEPEPNQEVKDKA